MGFVLGAVVIVASLIWIFKSSGGTTSTGPKGANAEHELMNACGDDKGLAERLIKLEEKRSPEISRAEAVTRALNRYRRDRGA
jgi:hypothetical protein